MQTKKKNQDVLKSRPVDILGALIKLDLDSRRGYEQVLRRLEDGQLKTQIARFYDDHGKHLDRLKSSIIELGEEVPHYDAQLNGFFMNPVETLQSLRNTPNILEALRGGERLTNKTYEEALKLELPDSARMIVEENFQDEQRHLTWVMQAISMRVWEQ